MARFHYWRLSQSHATFNLSRLRGQKLLNLNIYMYNLAWRTLKLSQKKSGNAINVSQHYQFSVSVSVYLFANIKYNTNYNNNNTFGSSPGSNLLI